MGWSIDLAKPALDKLFSNLGKKYSISHPDAAQQTALIKYEDEIPVTVMQTIAKLFPEFVYVAFLPNSTFHSTQEEADRHF